MLKSATKMTKWLRKSPSSSSLHLSYTYYNSKPNLHVESFYTNIYFFKVKNKLNFLIFLSVLTSLPRRPASRRAS